MDFAFLAMVNRVLLMGQQSTITTLETDNSTFGYKAQLSVNDTIQDLALRLRLKTRLVNFTFDTVISQKTYALPKRIIYPPYDLRDKTNNQIITPISTMDLDTFLPNDTSNGLTSSKNYYLEQIDGVTTQPSSSGEKVYSISSNSSDNATISIQGIDTSDNYVNEEVTLNGTTAVASVNTYKSIDSISKPFTTGTITFRNSGSTTTYLTLGASETNYRRVIIALSPVPSSVITIYGRGYIQAHSLINPYDVPVGMTEDYLNAIIAGSYYRFMMFDPKTSTVAVETMAGMYESEIGKLRAADTKDGTLKFMKSPRWMGTRGTYFRPLERDAK